MTVQKWEFHAYLADLKKWSETPDVSLIWRQWSNSSKNDWDKINDLGEEGWELVSVTPITGSDESGSTYTSQVVYTFKRPKGGPSPAG